MNRHNCCCFNCDDGAFAGNSLEELCRIRLRDFMRPRRERRSAVRSFGSEAGPLIARVSVGDRGGRGEWFIGRWQGSDGVRGRAAAMAPSNQVSPPVELHPGGGDRVQGSGALRDMGMTKASHSVNAATPMRMRDVTGRAVKQKNHPVRRARPDGEPYPCGKTMAEIIPLSPEMVIS
ncbi:hypothetical protein [Thermomonospora sp. CIF 1]|uniref:hypothetical protein n=1 Tax=Thermomonospora sp. CIF 1 TaxID=1916083 RepID=UPI00257C415E|nr:hypothetical protein [Thermomonospora sp. CIF 1]